MKCQELSQIQIGTAVASWMPAMTEEEDRLVAALEKGEATPQQQKQAAHMLRDLEHEVKELSELNQRA